MRQSLFTIALFFLTNGTKAQCPDGAYAFVTFYTTWHIEPGVGIINDTSNYFNVYNFQPGTTVLYYNIHGILIDSVITSPEGAGSVTLQNYFNDSMILDTVEMTWGLATNGICSTKVGAFALLPVKFSRFSVTGTGNTVSVNWQTEQDEPGIKYIIQQSENGTDFTDLTTVVSTQTNTGNYSYTGLLFFNKTRYFRIKLVTKDQRYFYSETRTLNANNSNEIVISVTDGNKLSVKAPEEFVKGYYSIYNEAGNLLRRGKVFSKTFMLSPNISRGVYYIKFLNFQGKRITRSFIILD